MLKQLNIRKHIDKNTCVDSRTRRTSSHHPYTCVFVCGLWATLMHLVINPITVFGVAKGTHCVVWDAFNALYLSYPEHLFSSNKNMLVIFITAKQVV